VKTCRFLIDEVPVFLMRCVGAEVRRRMRPPADLPLSLLPMRPIGAPPDEATDTYDTIDWLLKNIPNNNGKVGQ